MLVRFDTFHIVTGTQTEKTQHKLHIATVSSTENNSSARNKAV